MVPNNNLIWIASKACHHSAKHLLLNFNGRCQVVQKEFLERLLWAHGVGKQGEEVIQPLHNLPEKEGV